MEFEDVSERVEWETRRIAAAFGGEEWTHYRSGSVWHCSGKIGPKRLEWQLSGETLRLTTLSIAQKGKRRTLAYFLPTFGMRSGESDALLARGLYCLGLEPQDAPMQLPTLTAHGSRENGTAAFHAPRVLAAKVAGQWRWTPMRISGRSGQPNGA